MKREEYISQDKWKIIIENVPIISVDLIIFYEGGLVLGKRSNEPAKGEWFVPGGRVMKNEKLEDAIHRVADEELGTEINIERRLGTYEHMYETSEVEGVKSKHYVVNAYVCTINNDDFASDSQHDDIKIFYDLPNGLHEYVEDYLKDLKEDSRFKFEILESFKE